MRRRRTTSAVHADRMIPKLLKNMPGINAVFFLFNIFLISAALTIFVNQTVYAETYTVIIPAAQEHAGAESAVESASEAETAPLSEDRVSISFQMDSNGIYAIVYTITQETDADKDDLADAPAGEAGTDEGPAIGGTDVTADPAGEAGTNEEPVLGGTDAAAAPAPVRAAPADQTLEGEDEAYILVKKIFSGITEDEIPDDFSVAISDGTTAYILTRDPQEENITYSASEDGLTRTWRVDHVITGAAYMISEFGEEIEGYTVTSSGLGDTQTVTAADITYTIGKHETTCSQQDWPVDDNTLFAASMTNKTGGKGSLIISKYRLSESERRAVEEILLPRLRAVDSNVWKMPVHYYSVEEHPDGFQINAGIVTYDPDAQQVTLSDTDIWQHVASVSFTKNEPGNGDFTILNDYERIPGVELPSSGGPGTRTLYMLGLAIIVLAGAGLVLRKWGP